MNLLIFLAFISSTLGHHQYIVQLKSSTTLSGASRDDILAMQATLDECLTKSNISFTTTTQYSKVFAGRAITLDDDSDFNGLKACPEVEKVWPSRTIPAPRAIEGGPVRPLEFYTHNYTGVAAAQKLGLSGKGIRVGIIDTGVDYTHPAFGTCKKIGDVGCTFQYGYDFVGNRFTGSGQTYPSNDPYENCLGHGTHVSGILAGKDAAGHVMGVAQNVKLGMYRVFGCQGGTTPELIIAAMRKAFDDGMDVINMSLGSDGGFTDSPEAIVVEELSKQGVIFSIAVGNDGKDGIWMASNPSVAHSATSVTSFDSFQGVRRTFRIGSQTRDIVFAFNLLPMSPPNPDVFNVQLVADLDKSVFGYVASEMCKAPVVDVKGKIVLITRGTCTFYEKSLLLEKAGALAVIIANNRAGDIGHIAPASTMPIYTISQADGRYLATFLSTQQGSPQMLAFSKKDIIADLATGGEISGFSTWGLGPDLEIKPDFGAPGGYIYSAYPQSKGSYAVLSGTSMATPYISGCYALYLEQINISNAGRTMKYKTDPVILRDLLSVYASAMDKQDAAMNESSIPVPRQGGGMIQLDKALYGMSSINPAKLSVGVMPMTAPMSFRISNYSDKKKQYSIRLNNAPSVDVTDSGHPSILNSSCSASFSTDGTQYSSTLLVEVESQTSFTVYFAAGIDNSLSNDKQYFISGYIEVSPKTLVRNAYILDVQDFVMSVSFAGYQGDLMMQNVIDASLRRKVSATWDRLTGGSPKHLAVAHGVTESLQINDFSIATDWVLLQYRILVPLERISLEVYDRNGILGNINTKARMTRNGNNKNDKVNFITNYRWDGSYTDQNGVKGWVGVGVYTLVLSYEAVKMIAASEAVTGSVSFPPISMQWTDQGYATYQAQQQ